MLMDQLQRSATELTAAPRFLGTGLLVERSDTERILLLYQTLATRLPRLVGLTHETLLALHALCDSSPRQTLVRVCSYAHEDAERVADQGLFSRATK
jgi:hypothetical protein